MKKVRKVKKITRIIYLKLRCVRRDYSQLIATFISDRAKKCINCNRACNLLSKLCCRSPAARSLALRDLLESSLFLSASCLFGAPKKEPLKESKQGCLLMEQNYRLVHNRTFSVTFYGIKKNVKVLIF